jgi:hypothetical protein
MGNKLQLKGLRRLVEPDGHSQDEARNGRISKDFILAAGVLPTP